MPSFEYLYTQQATGCFDIDNIGNFALSCFNDNFEEYILIAKTTQGWTQLLSYGPAYRGDIDYHIYMGTKNCKYECIEFSSQKISSVVHRFINDPKKKITQVEVIEINEAYDKINPIKELLLLD